MNFITFLLKMVNCKKNYERKCHHHLNILRFTLCYYAYHIFIIPNFIFFWLWQAKQPGFSVPVLFVLCAVGRSSNMQNVPFVYMQLTLMVERLRLPFLAENPRKIEKITYLYFFFVLSNCRMSLLCILCT